MNGCELDGFKLSVEKTQAKSERSTIPAEVTEDCTTIFVGNMNF